jgi:hypothetical protein
MNKFATERAPDDGYCMTSVRIPISLLKEAQAMKHKRLLRGANGGSVSQLVIEALRYYLPLAAQKLEQAKP